MYTYLEELEAQAKKDKKRMENTARLNSAQGWNNNAYGSAECASTRWDDILDAYNEYKCNEAW